MDGGATGRIFWQVCTVRGIFSVVSADGINVSVDRAVSLTPFTCQVNNPYSCRDFTDLYFSVDYHVCEEYVISHTGKRGTASGP